MEDQRKCRYCGTVQDISKFQIAATIKGKVYKRHKCQSCYQKTKTICRKSKYDCINDLKKLAKCEICENDDFRVLEFHHKNPKIKTIEVSEAARRSWSKERILEEIAKCQILCANCHKIFHWNERNLNKDD